MDKDEQPSAAQAEVASVEQAVAHCPGPQAGDEAVADAQSQSVSMDEAVSAVSMEEAVSAVSMEEAVSDVAPELQAPSLAPDVSQPSSGQGTAATTGDGNGSEISMEKLRIGPSNTRKRDVPSTAWATSSSSLHKPRLDYSQVEWPLADRFSSRSQTLLEKLTSIILRMVRPARPRRHTPIQTPVPQT